MEGQYCNYQLPLAMIPSDLAEVRAHDAAFGKAGRALRVCTTQYLHPSNHNHLHRAPSESEETGPFVEIFTAFLVDAAERTLRAARQA